MAETDNIARMAHEISREIFVEFGWQQIGPMNENWECALNTHGCETHPSDVVYWYDDPYFARRIYVNCDLKSYAKDSISKAALGGALRSLATATDCANISAGWQALYLHQDTTHRVIGALFVYNHDGEYDKDFHARISEVDSESYRLRAGNKMTAFGPADICYLKTITADMRMLRGDGHLPKRDECPFFYPDLFFRKAVRDRIAAASIEMLTGPWQLVRYNVDGEAALLVYYRHAGNTIDEFLYLIDFLLHYQVLHSAKHIKIRMPNAAKEAAARFQQACDVYVTGQRAVRERLDRVTFHSITSVYTKFSSVELGMRDAH